MEIRIFGHCILSMYCASRAHSEQHLGWLRLWETRTGRCWEFGQAVCPGAWLLPLVDM